MLFQRVNRSDPEKIFIVVMNSYSTASLSNGQPVAWDYTTDYNGVSVTKPPAVATCAGASFAGVAAETIAHNAYGLVQVWGYHSSTICKTMSTTGNGARGWVAIVAGAPLTMPLAADFALEAMSTGSAKLQSVCCGFALAAQGSYTTKHIAVFIKAL